MAPNPSLGIERRSLTGVGQQPSKGRRVREGRVLVPRRSPMDASPSHRAELDPDVPSCGLQHLSERTAEPEAR
jgi:hypothetical protein